MFNSKGQASSVFNILIAAVVALAILGLLMSVLGMINIGSTTNPEDVAKELLKNAQNKPYSPYTKDAVFSTSAKTVTAAGLSTELQIGSENIFISNPTEITGFETSDKMLNYTSSSTKKVKMLAICGDNVDEINPIVDAYISGSSISSSGNAFSCYLMIYPFTG